MKGHGDPAALAAAYRDQMNARRELTEADQETIADLLAGPHTLDTIAAGEGATVPMRGLGIPHVSDLTPEELADE